MQGVLPEDANEEKCIRKISTCYLIVADKLYKMGRYAPMLRCVSERETTLIMKEVHEGACSSHIGGRALSGKIIRVGYYWTRMLEYCTEFVSKCDKFQVYAPFIHSPLMRPRVHENIEVI